MSSNLKFFPKVLTLWLIVAQVLLPLPATAGISQLPPLVKQNVPPNVFYTLDDSGSMMFEVMPETLRPYGDGRDVSGGLPGRDWTTTDIGEYCKAEWQRRSGDWHWNGCSIRFVYPSPNGVYSTSNYDGRYAAVAFFNDNITVARWRSARLNKSYYDPSTRYLPWVDQNTISLTNPYGLPMANANPARAQYNPVKALGRTMDLTADQTESAYWLDDDALNVTEESKTYFPATYYIFSPRSSVDASYPDCSGANVNESNLNCFTRIEIRPRRGANTPRVYTRAATRTDCRTSDGGTLVCSYAEELQNFANWFQYYRSRVLMARGATATAFAVQPTNLRVGFGTINTKDTVVVDIDEDFSELNKRKFLTQLYNQPIETKGTPLIKSTDDVGRYFSDQLSGRSGVNSPWYSKRSASAAACRQAYNILMTDGYWSAGDKAEEAPGNHDGEIPPIIDGSTYRYNKERPYADAAHSDTLADVAFYYWSRDLAPDLANIVPLPRDGSDVAHWQHVVQFTVGLGVEGSLNSKTDLPALTAGTKVWPDPTTNDAHKTDDLWHAAVNSRGRYFSASNPVEFSDALKQALNDIASRSGDAAALAVSNNTLGSDLKLYTATYRTGDWSGKLEQKSVYYNASDPTDSANGNVLRTPDWDTDTVIPAFASRNIVTTAASGTGGVNFQVGGLSPSQMSIFDTAAASFVASDPVDGADLVNYLRGDKEREGNPFRKRLYWLGDLVNSDPQYLSVGRDHGYAFLPTGSVGKGSYQAFLNWKKSRPATVFVGSNDGMLHAFDATGRQNERGTGGTERFAYVPGAVIPNMPLLASPNYTHRFFVDGTVSIGDAAIGGDPRAPWRTVLVGGTGAGGKSIFALDVTDPSNFNASKVLWEKTAVGDDDLGFTIGVPQIGRLKNGDWVAVFGNGFSSVNGVATLYIVKLDTGVVTKIPTSAGSRAAPNGLSTPKLLIGPDATIQAAYAGDINGNLWKFNLDATTVSVAFGGSPLFVATDAINGSGRRQPITVQPQLYPHPTNGYMVVFGTGKIFEDNDAATTDIETLYGIWDKAESPSVVAKTALVKQDLSIYNTNYYQVSRRVIDWTTKRGWFLSLDKTVSERLISDPILFEDQAFFTTLIPGAGSNICTSDGRSATIQISPLNGAALGYATMDADGDGVIGASDASVSGSIGAATFGTTLVRTGNRKMKQYQAGSKDGAIVNGGSGGSECSGSNCDPSKGDKGQDRNASGQIPTARLWRQLLGRP